MGRELAKHPAYEPDGYATTQNQIRDVLKLRQGQTLNALVQKATADPVEHQDDPIWQQLEPEALSEYELPEEQIGRPMHRKSRRQELETLLIARKQPVSAE